MIPYELLEKYFKDVVCEELQKEFKDGHIVLDYIYDIEELDDEYAVVFDIQRPNDDKSVFYSSYLITKTEIKKYERKMKFQNLNT